MKNTYGTSLSVTIFGESHGDCIGAVIDGIAPGIKINSEYIEKKLSARRPCGSISTARVEKDNYSIVSGVFNGVSHFYPNIILLMVMSNEIERGYYQKMAD